VRGVDGPVDLHGDVDQRLRRWHVQRYGLHRIRWYFRPRVPALQTVCVTATALLVHYLHVDRVTSRAVTRLTAEADQGVQDRFAGKELESLQDAGGVWDLRELLAIPGLAADQPIGPIWSPDECGSCPRGA
jgi:hypothetical protein